MESQRNTNSSDKILSIATRIAQAHGYGGLSVRRLAEEVGVKPASLYHHFPSKAALAAAVARRYWENSSTQLEELLNRLPDPTDCLRRYPNMFRKALENDNRICLCSFMTAEYDDLPENVRQEVRTFSDVHITWLAKVLASAGIVNPNIAKERAQAIYAAITGAQLMARGRFDLSLFDTLITSYRATGLLPA